MGIINVYGKWDLKKNDWNTNFSYHDRGRAFAIARYEEIINNINDGVDYVILAYGTRVEDHSKDYINIKESINGIDKVISYFKNKNKNIIVELFLMDADAPILEDARKLANYIDSLSSLSTTNSVNLIGLSKCGAMVFNIPKYFRNSSSYSKTNVYTIASPFTGTKLASPGIFYPEVERKIVSIFGNNRMSKLVYDGLISAYESVSSNSHMDYDIAMLGGISDDKLKLYDDSLIKNMFFKDNIDAIKRVAKYRNLVTGIDDKTFGEAVRTLNFNGIGLCILNDMFFDGKSDGMVGVCAQREVESYYEDINFKSDILVSSHHDVASCDRVFNDILYIVDDTIDEYNDKVKYRKKIR